MLGLGWAGHVVYVGTLGKFCALCAGMGARVRRIFPSLLFLIVFDCLMRLAALMRPCGLVFSAPGHLCCPKFSSALQAVDLVMSTSRLHSALLPHTPSSSGFPIMLQIFQLVDWDWRAGKCFDTKTRYCNSNGYDITQRRVFNLQQTIGYLSFQKW